MSAGTANVDTTRPAVRLRGITKVYPGVRANDRVDLDIGAGSIHGLLGENGAGKSTLMKILFGLVQPDEGTIEIDGRPVRLRGPADAIAAGVGMVQQHFSLIDDFTVAENVLLGDEPRRNGLLLDRAEAVRSVQALADRFGFRLDASRRVASLAVGARQRVEILKALRRGARLLILDEPTATLAPQEVAELFAVLRTLRDRGTTIIVISHRLAEILEICDRVSVLRDGRLVGHREIDPGEREPGPHRAAAESALARLMVGRDLPPPPRHGGTPGDVALRLEGVSDGRGFGPIDLVVRRGQIVGIAGVEGNGQTELVELVVGVRRCTGGRVVLDGQEVTRWSVRRRLRAGVAHIAEDRHAAAVALEMSVTANSVLGFHDQPPVAPHRGWFSRPAAERFANEVVEQFRVRTAGVHSPLSSLSGGNQQKLVVGRELRRNPVLMVASQPTRGLDIAATQFVHEELASLRAAGCAVLLVSLDLSEILTLADEVVVLYGKRVAGSVPAAEADPELLGAWMTGTGRGSDRGPA